MSALGMYVRAHVVHGLDLLVEHGYLLRMPQAKKIHPDLFELRIRGKVAVRLLYGFFENKIYVHHGFIKKTNSLPRREIVTALKRRRNLDEYITYV